jgi:hypothetical protein
MVVALIHIGQYLYGVWHVEETTWSASSVPYVFLSPDRVGFSELRQYDTQTTVLLNNETSLDLTDVTVTLPRKGRALVTSSSGEITYFDKFDHVLRLEKIPSQVAAAVTIWHNDRLTSDYELKASCTQSGNVKIPVNGDPNSVSSFYKWGFWTCLATIAVGLMANAIRWLQTTPSSKQTESPATA